jgi:hypothetical protein
MNSYGNKIIRTAVLALLAARAISAQPADDRIILPPAPVLDRSEIVPAGPAAPADSAAATPLKPPPQLDVEDVVIYGSDRYRITPGDKHERLFAPLALPQDASFILARDNLYHQLPEGANQFLRAQDWSVSSQLLSKCYASVGAWQTFSGKLILGKQNLRLNNDQTIDLFFDLKHDQSWGHREKYYYYRNESVRGTCLYQIEKHVETQSYLAVENDRANQPNHYQSRTLADYEFGTLLNVYQGDNGSATISLAYQTGSLADSADLAYNSSFVQAKGSLRWHGILTTGSIDFLNYGLTFPDAPGRPDSVKYKTNLFTLALKAEGLTLYRRQLVLNGGLACAFYTNYLTGTDNPVQAVVYPQARLEYVAYRDWDLFLAYQPEITFTPLKTIYQTNPYLNKNVEIMPEEKYLNLTLGGQYRWSGGLTVDASVGHERIAHYRRYTFNPVDSLYSVRVTTNSVYPSSGVQVNQAALSLKTKEFYRTLCEVFVQARSARFLEGSAPVPFYPALQTGLVVSGKWFREIEHRYYLYRIAEQSWGPAAGQTLPAATVLDLALTCDLNEFFKVYAEGYVAFNRPYRRWAGYTEPQFKISTGLRYRW